MRRFIIGLAAFGLIASSTPSISAPCRDAKGKFTKCVKTTHVKTTRCRDTKGKFVKCGTKGAKAG
jgi:hypothetical protein